MCVCGGCLVVLCELGKGLVARGQYASQRVFRWFMANREVWTFFFEKPKKKPGSGLERVFVGAGQAAGDGTSSKWGDGSVQGS